MPNEPIMSPGIKARAPKPNSNSPSTTPRRYPQRVMNMPAGRAIRAYATYVVACTIVLCTIDISSDS